MSGLTSEFIVAFLLGFLTNLWVAAASLAVGLCVGGALAWLRLRSRWFGRPAGMITGLLRATPTFVAMFFLLNLLPKTATIAGVTVAVPGALILVLALGIYAAANISDNLLESLRHKDQGSVPAALLFIPNTMRAFFVLVMASSTGAAIGVPEAITTTLRQADRLPTIGARIVLVLAVIAFFTVFMQATNLVLRSLKAWLTPWPDTADDHMASLSEYEHLALITLHDMVRVISHYGWVVVLVVGLAIVAGTVAPLPPRNITIESGPVGGSWYETAQKYAAFLEARGVHVKVRTRDDSFNIIEDIDYPDSDADVGFIVQRLDPRSAPNVMSLGSTEYQPLFVFYHRSLGENLTLAGLRGARIGLPSVASATTDAALPILRAFGVTPETSFISFTPFTEEVKRLLAGQSDAAFMMLRPDAAVIRELAHRDDLRIMDLQQSGAIAQQFPSLSHVVVPQATFDLATNIPPEDVHLIAGTTQVIVKKTMHPAIVYLLLEAMSDAHRAATAVTKDSEFPAIHDTRLPVSELAKDYYASGVPWIYKNLPLWLASILGYYIVLVIPFAIIMPLYSWLGLPDLSEILKWLRSLVWLRMLQRLENRLQAGQPFTRSDHATFHLIRVSLDHPDASATCKVAVARITERLTVEPVDEAAPALPEPGIASPAQLQAET